MTSRALLCVLLLAASSSVAAREVRLAGPGGGGGKIDQCQEITNAVEEATAKPPAKPRVTTTSTQPRKPAKSAPAVRSAGDDDGVAPRVTTPRWHSFLPGMFR